MHGSMLAAGGNQASRLDRAAQAPPVDPTATRSGGDTCNRVRAVSVAVGTMRTGRSCAAARAEDAGLGGGRVMPWILVFKRH